MHAEHVGVERLGGDVSHELVRRPRVVPVMIVAQREIAEVHGVTPACPDVCLLLFVGATTMLDADASVVNAGIQRKACPAPVSTSPTTCPISSIAWARRSSPTSLRMPSPRAI